VQGVGWIAESALGIPHDLAVIFAAVVVISFAATTLDSAMRILRYVLQELGSQYRVPALQNGMAATVLGAVLVAMLALGVDRGAGGMRIWPLFGTTNQLTGGLTLLVISVFLLSLGRRAWITLVPMTFLFVMTTWAMLTQLSGYFGNRQWLLAGIGAAIFCLEVWLVLEAVAVFRRMWNRRPPVTGTPELVEYDHGVPHEPRA
jgi:carbon starvation protein